MELNQSADLGVKDDRDKADAASCSATPSSASALSQALDRDGIAQAIMRGPFLRCVARRRLPRLAGVRPGVGGLLSLHRLDTAKALLAELGFKDTDNNGILNWTTGPLSGQDLILSLRASQDAIETVNIGEALVNQWGKVGIKINMRPTSSQTE